MPICILAASLKTKPWKHIFESEFRRQKSGVRIIGDWKPQTGGGAPRISLKCRGESCIRPYLYWVNLPIDQDFGRTQGFAPTFHAFIFKRRIVNPPLPSLILQFKIKWQVHPDPYALVSLQRGGKNPLSGRFQRRFI